MIGRCSGDVDALGFQPAAFGIVESGAGSGTLADILRWSRRAQEPTTAWLHHYRDRAMQLSERQRETLDSESITDRCVGRNHARRC
jgi:SAM-dependent MidA family methyltransferase